MPKVTFVNEKVELDVPAGANLRQEAMKAGIDVYGGLKRYLNCRGNGLCGTCAVLIAKGMENVGPRTLAERVNLTAHPVSMLAVLGNEDTMRLACQVKVNGDCTVQTRPAFNLAGENFWQKPYPNK
jgi:2Fe-2S ferredoxin